MDTVQEETLNNTQNQTATQSGTSQTDSPKLDEKSTPQAGAENSNLEDILTEEVPPAFLGGDVEKNPKYQSLNDKYIRLHADFDNYRRRVARESLELIQTASSNLLEKLLPTLENLDHAFDPQKKATKLEDFEEGIRLIYKSFKDVLDDAGLEEINPEGEVFDPVYHEALMQQAHPTLAEGKVIQVFQKGYKVKNKILKHAKVVLSLGPQA